MITPKDIDDIYAKLGALSMELDDDPLAFGPKRLNLKVSTVRAMLSEAEKIFQDISRKLQHSRRDLRESQAYLDLRKKDLFVNDPDTRAGRSVSDREAVAAMKLANEINATNTINNACEDLQAILIVVKAKRADLKDAEGRLRDQMRLCSEEIALGSKWGSSIFSGSQRHMAAAVAIDPDQASDLVEPKSTTDDPDDDLVDRLISSNYKPTNLETTLSSIDETIEVVPVKTTVDVSLRRPPQTTTDEPTVVVAPPELVVDKPDGGWLGTATSKSSHSMPHNGDDNLDTFLGMMPSTIADVSTIESQSDQFVSDKSFSSLEDLLI